MGQRMRYGSSSRGTQEILGMSPEEKTAEIENDRDTTLYPNQVHQKTVKMIFWKISQPRYFFKMIITQLLHPISPIL